jgi:PAS domain-containing protein
VSTSINQNSISYLTFNLDPIATMDQDPNHRNYLHHHNLQHHPEENDVPHNYFGHMQLTTTSYAEPSYLSMHHPQDQNTLTAQHQHQHHQHQHHHMGVVPMVSGAMQMQLPAAITPQAYHQDHGMGMGSPVGALVFDGNGLGPMVNLGYPEQQSMLGTIQYIQPLEPHTMAQDNRFAINLPISGGMDEYTTHPISSANTLTEFTKRKNWPQRLLEEVPDFMHVLSPDGKIIYAAPSAKQVTGYAAEELVGKILADFLHGDDRGL